MESSEIDELWDFEHVDATFPQHEPLVQALGLLVLSSATAESTLRSTIDGTYILGDDAYIFTDGESTTWLIEKIRMLCATSRKKFEGAELIEIVKLCNELKRLFEARNRFIHSEYGITSKGIYVTLMIRRHKESNPATFEVSDISKLAVALTRCSTKLYNKVAH